MKARSNFNQFRMAYALLRDSEAIWFRIAVSIRSGSSADAFVGIDLNGFFRATRRMLIIKLVISFLMMMCTWLSKATYTAFRALWLRMTKKVKSLN